jgi:hypothetical protein
MYREELPGEVMSIRVGEQAAMARPGYHADVRDTRSGITDVLHAFTLGNIILYIFLGTAIVLRGVMSFTLHMWYPWIQGADDALLMRQALPGYESSDDSMTLAKNPGYGYWIRFYSKIGLSADAAQFCIWLLAALVMGFALWHLFHSRFLAIFTFLYVLWNPLAFENWLGTRLYRNSLFAPLTFLLLGLLIVFLGMVIPLRGNRAGDSLQRSSHSKNAVPSFRISPLQYCLYAFLGVCTGITMCLLYLLKEDSIWLLPMFVFVILFKTFRIVRSNVALLSKVLVVFLSSVPLITLFVGVSASMQHIQRHFGVSLLNTRTQGELEGFVERIYLIDNPEQTTDIWAPTSSIQKAIDVSPTMQGNHKLIQELFHSGFVAPDIQQNPIRGDFLTWQIRAALQNSGQWNNESQIQRMFRDVNGELDQAFTDGRLRETDKVFLTSGMVPRSGGEISELIKPTLRAFRWNINNLDMFQITTGFNDTASNPQNVAGLEKVRIDPSNPNPSVLSFFTVDDANRVTTVLSKAYAAVNGLLCMLFAATMIVSISRAIRGRSAEAVALTLSILLFLYALVYVFSVVWFTQYVGKEYVTFFYSAGSTAPFVVTAFFLGLGALSAFYRSEYRVEEK